MAENRPSVTDTYRRVYSKAEEEEEVVVNTVYTTYVCICTVYNGIICVSFSTSYKCVMSMLVDELNEIRFCLFYSILL